MPFSVKWTQFYLEEKGMRAISLFHHLWITTEGGSLEERMNRQFYCGGMAYLGKTSLEFVSEL